MNTGERSSAQSLQDTVIDGGYCIGCGGCAAVSGSNFEVRLDAMGRKQARLLHAGESGVDYEKICPFGAEADSEDLIAADLFPDSATHPQIGRHIGTWAGHVREGEFRNRGSSGGMGNWLASELLRTERVESVVQVSTSAGRTLFNYEIFGTASQVLENGKSRYYPVDLAEVLQRIRTSPDKVAIVGVPCFVKAIRLMGRADPALDAKIGYTIGLVCGHLKTTAFAEMFSWQMGVPPGHLQSIDFRVKNESGRADNYSIKVTGSDLKGRAVTKIAQNKSLFGYLWGHGFFKYRACDYCDDVLAELADVAVGDAWLPGYAQDSMGTNVVISRSADIDAMIRAAIDEDRLRMDVITADQVARSQDAGLRHRRLGLSVRLEDKRRAGRWAPPKRVQPGSDNLNKRQRWVYRIREKMSERSHYAFAKAVKSGRFSTFKRQMKPWMDVHDFVNRSISWKALLKRLMFSPFIK